MDAPASGIATRYHRGRAGRRPHASEVLVIAGGGAWDIPEMAGRTRVRLRAAGEALRASRRRAQMSQEFLGKMIGATQQTVSRWEKGLGAPEPVYRRALADVLGVEPGVWAAR